MPLENDPPPLILFYHFLFLKINRKPLFRFMQKARDSTEKDTSWSAQTFLYIKVFGDRDHGIEIFFSLRFNKSISNLNRLTGRIRFSTGDFLLNWPQYTNCSFFSSPMPWLPLKQEILCMYYWKAIPSSKSNNLHMKFYFQSAFSRCFMSDLLILFKLLSFDIFFQWLNLLQTQKIHSKFYQ